jgi:hypothetical protein
VNPTTGALAASQKVAASVAANADFKMTISKWNLASAPATQQGALRSLLPANFQMPTVK